MSDKLTEARSLLEKRLAEIDAERDQLKAAIKQLEAVAGTSSQPASKSSRNSASRTRSKGSTGSRKRARRGQREKQLLSSIKANPDYRVSDHARQVGVSPQQLYPLLNRLVAKDVVVKKDSRYRVKA
jgi:hypothetical protein